MGEPILWLVVALAAATLVLTGVVVYLLLSGRRADSRETLEALLETERDAMIENIVLMNRESDAALREAMERSEGVLRGDVQSIFKIVREEQARSASAFERFARDTRGDAAGTETKVLRELVGIRSDMQARMKEVVLDHQKQSTELAGHLMSILAEIRTTVEGNLTKIRTDNDVKLEEMRRTVQEKLDKTLSERLAVSFRTVDEKLGLVQSGLGEMRSMAASVRDLKGVLTNVKTRGTYGETQLEAILSNLLTPDQYEAQARIYPGSSLQVDFAVKMPGVKGGEPCWLPMDAKFPVEDYDRLLKAGEDGDAAALAKARAGLERAVLTQAKSIREKYVRAPITTEFAVMYLPSEGLYAEVIRIPGLFERLQREFHITPAGPTVVSALINSLQMGFVTLALQERSAEVWKVLGDVKAEFEKFAVGFEKVRKKFDETKNSLDQMSTRERVMRRKMSSISLANAEALRAAEEESSDSDEGADEGFDGEEPVGVEDAASAQGVAPSSTAVPPHAN